MEQQMQQSDHDLLVTLVAKVDAFIAGQVTAQNDHESRIRALESSERTRLGNSQARRDMTTTTKWIIGTLCTLLSIAIAAVGLLIAAR